MKAEKGPLFGLGGGKGSADARIPLLEQVTGPGSPCGPSPSVAAALIWQSFQPSNPSELAEPADIDRSKGDSVSETLTEAARADIGTEKGTAATAAATGQGAGNEVRVGVPRFVMERCIGGGAVVSGYHSSCLEAVNAATAFLTAPQDLLAAQDGHDGELERLRRKKFCHLTVRLDGTMPRDSLAESATGSAEEKELASIVQQLKGALRGAGGVLLVTTSQPSLSKLQLLLAQRRRYLSHPMSSFIWSHKQEAELADEFKAVSLGRASFQIL